MNNKRDTPLDTDPLLDNMRLVYNAMSEGRLGHPDPAGTIRFDTFTALVLETMAFLAPGTKTHLEPGESPRMYDQGWRPIAERLGLLHIADKDGNPLSEAETAKTLARRENTARVRISKAWRTLKDRGLIVKVADAWEGRNSAFVLTIGDDAENRLLLAQAKELFANNPSGVMGNERPVLCNLPTNIALVFSTAGPRAADIRSGDPFPHPRPDLLMTLTMMAFDTYDPDTAPAGKIPRLYVDGWEWLADRMGMLHTPEGMAATEQDVRSVAETHVRRMWDELVEKGLLARIGEGADASLLLLLGDDEENERLLSLAKASLFATTTP